LYALMKDEARARSPSFVAREQDAKPIVERDLPGGGRVMFFTATGVAHAGPARPRLRRRGELMIVTRRRKLDPPQGATRRLHARINQ
jgi:hypothetical protein